MLDTLGYSPRSNCFYKQCHHLQYLEMQYCISYHMVWSTPSEFNQPINGRNWASSWICMKLRKTSHHVGFVFCCVMVHLHCYSSPFTCLEIRSFTERMIAFFFKVNRKITKMQNAAKNVWNSLRTENHLQRDWNVVTCNKSFKFKNKSISPCIFKDQHHVHNTWLSVHGVYSHMSADAEYMEWCAIKIHT